MNKLGNQSIERRRKLRHTTHNPRLDRIATIFVIRPTLRTHSSFQASNWALILMVNTFQPV